MTKEAAALSIKETFDIISSGYDNESLRFFRDSARLMAAYFRPDENLRLLDVATGTGNAALTLAASLPAARVTGVDFSPGMLAQARTKAAARGLHNVEFLEMDMQTLDFPDGRFDAAVSAFGIFFANDMERQLRHIAEKVKSGGNILITCFYDRSFSPCVDLFMDRIEKLGIERPPSRWLEIATEEKCAALLQAAGLSDVRVERKDLGYPLENAEKWWDVLWNAGHRGLIEQVSTGELDRFKSRHFEEIERLRSKDGIWLNVEVLFAVGTKP